MDNPLQSIRRKLSDSELSYLKDVCGVDLGDPQVREAVVALDAARNSLEAVQASRRWSNRPRVCSFCGRSSHVAGALAQAPDGACICTECASRCIEEIAGARQSDT